MTIKHKNSSSKDQATGQIRIIGGKWRGRKLPVIEANGLRPTGDRMKETLFNWLMHDIVDAKCLDIFAGTGALGFEAASRHAHSVTMLENAQTVARVIKQNIQKLNADNITLIEQDAFNFLAQKPEIPFDIIFIDPPFHKNHIKNTLNLLASNLFVHKDSLVYIESEIDAQEYINLGDWEIIKFKVSGQVKYHLIRPKT